MLLSMIQLPGAHLGGFREAQQGGEPLFLLSLSLPSLEFLSITA
jgi:hypothetical protein